MADEDNFDIDIYGDEGGQEEYSGEQAGNDYSTYENGRDQKPSSRQNGHNNTNGHPGGSAENAIKQEMDVTPSSSTLQGSFDKSQPAQQGVKRKTTMDDRPVDPNSTNAVQIIDLHWWITEDDLRGWCVKAGCEVELKEITFNEHKVNGKSKGYELSCWTALQLLWLTDVFSDKSTSNSHLKQPRQL